MIRYFGPGAACPIKFAADRFRRERGIELEIQDGRLSTPLQNFKLRHTGTKPRA